MATHIQLPASTVEEQQFPGILPPWTTDAVWRDTVASLINFPPGVGGSSGPGAARGWACVGGWPGSAIALPFPLSPVLPVPRALPPRAAARRLG